MLKSNNLNCPSLSSDIRMFRESLPRRNTAVDKITPHQLISFEMLSAGHHKTIKSPAMFVHM